MRKRRTRLSLAANLAAKLNFWRFHPVMRNLRTTISLADLVALGVRLELSSRSSHRLSRALYLLLAQKGKVRALNAKKRQNTKVSQLED